MPRKPRMDLLRPTGAALMPCSFKVLIMVFLPKGYPTFLSAARKRVKLQPVFRVAISTSNRTISAAVRPALSVSLKLQTLVPTGHSTPGPLLSRFSHENERLSIAVRAGGHQQLWRPIAVLMG